MVSQLLSPTEQGFVLDSRGRDNINKYVTFIYITAN